MTVPPSLPESPGSVDMVTGQMELRSCTQQLFRLQRGAVSEQGWFPMTMAANIGERVAVHLLALRFTISYLYK